MSRFIQIIAFLFPLIFIFPDRFLEYLHKWAGWRSSYIPSLDSFLFTMFLLGWFVYGHGEKYGVIRKHYIISYHIIDDRRCPYKGTKQHMNDFIHAYSYGGNNEHEQTGCEMLPTRLCTVYCACAFAVNAWWGGSRPKTSSGGEINIRSINQGMWAEITFLIKNKKRKENQSEGKKQPRKPHLSSMFTWTVK